MKEIHNRSFLIADDDADDREFIAEALLTAGFKGITKYFDHGAALLEFLHSKSYRAGDLIILDLNMPVKDGFATLRELKTSEQLESYPVVILTSSGNKADEERCRQLGCEGYYHKPLSYKEYHQLANDVMSAA